MENIKQVLANLERSCLHVHEIDRETPLPVHTTLVDTHFVMHGAQIVHVGNLKSIESFSLRFKPKDLNAYRLRATEHFKGKAEGTTWEFKFCPYCGKEIKVSAKQNH